ncbi:MAG: glycosyltransferase family 4 protein [Deltaproteobacteria bacterium]|nr:glycosyltransferase family 4 protein [Deltaproteobacteria bacterium]
MKLLVFSHKECWRSRASPSGFATDGGFPMQMAALSELFDETTLLLPCKRRGRSEQEAPLRGHNLRVRPLPELEGADLRRKLRVPAWLFRAAPTFLEELLRADAVHTPIPGDVGTLGMLLAYAARTPLFVRHCGNWLAPRTPAERFWRFFMEHAASDRNVMLATGGGPRPPSEVNPRVRWIFSTSLTSEQLRTQGRPRRHPSGRPIRLVIACRQEPAKGTDVVLRALASLKKGEHTLDVLGAGSGLDRSTALAASLGVSEHVRFHGGVSHVEVLEALSAADLFVFPTTSSEGFPKAVLEALACGLPVISTSVSVIPELLRNGAGVISSADGPSVARAIEETMASAETYERSSVRAVEAARSYSLEAWRAAIGEHLCAWGPLRKGETELAGSTSSATESRAKP